MNSFSRSPHILIVFLLLIFQIPAYSLTLDAENETFQSELERFLVQTQNSGFTRNINLSQLEQFYAARQYQPVWLRSNNASPPPLNIALHLIASAEAEGLDAREYHLQQLMQLSKDSTASFNYELEFQTTWSLLQLAHDLYRGRFNATDLDPDWHIPQPEFNASNFLLKATKSGNFQQSFERLPPHNPSYQLLKKALAKFRDLKAHHVTWTKIPSIPVLRPDDVHRFIPLIRQRIAEAYETHGMIEYKLDDKQNTRYDHLLAYAIKTFQHQHGLNPDGIIGPNTLKALNKTPAEKIQQLRINMERLRWLPRNLGERYLLVNIAGFQLAAVDKDQYELEMRIIVGRNYRSTPSFHSHISHVILNPYWNVPTSIARKDLLPKQQKDPRYFASQNIHVYTDYTYRSEPIDPGTIDWQAIHKGFPYALRQDPGKKNALGSIKFMLPNPFSIYLHDTPSKGLFNKEIRTFSSGCIRLEKPIALAAFAFQGERSVEELEEQINTHVTKQINLTKPLPTYIVYLTTWVDSQDNIHYSPDTYGRDERALKVAHW